MSLTLLFDLDDTLLDTNMDAFVPAYFQGLSKHVGDRVAPEIMLRALVHGMNLMNESEDPTRTLQEVFEADFYRTLGIPKSELWDAFEDFLRSCVYIDWNAYPKTAGCSSLDRVGVLSRVSG